MFLGVVLRNNSVENLVPADRVAVSCLVIDCLDDVICFYSNQMFFFVWCAVYCVCVCVCGVCVCVVCSISCVCVCVRACGVQYIVCVCARVWCAVCRVCVCECACVRVWCAVYIFQYTSL